METESENKKTCFKYENEKTCFKCVSFGGIVEGKRYKCNLVRTETYWYPEMVCSSYCTEEDWDKQSLDLIVGIEQDGRRV